ncbi:MAG: hypothetical protein AAGC60_24700 [Acidobacteriota bacterium]
MATESLGFGDYLKAAFTWRPRIPALGNLPLNYLGLATFGVLGIANPGFLLLGAALELAYLTWLSSNPRFQKLVRGERILAAQRSWQERVTAALARLQPASRERYQRLLLQSHDVLGTSEILGEVDSSTMRAMRGGGLNQMLWIFLRLLLSRELLEGNLQRVDAAALEQETEQLEARIAAEEPDSALVRSLRGTLEIQQRRLDNLVRSRESLAVVDAELERIENQVVLIREEVVVSGKAEVLSTRLDAVTSTLSETNRWMEQNARIFGELGVDPLGAVPPDLPDLPVPALEQEAGS